MVFVIDEDAYALLDNYLNQVKAAFPGSEGKEVILDIETRVAELFQQRIDRGAHVINIECVREVINTIGYPQGFASASAETFTENECKGRGPLYRSTTNRVLGGVLGGIAEHQGWDPKMVRLVFVLLAICTQLVPCVIGYMVCWMVIPEKDSPKSICQQQLGEIKVSSGFSMKRFFSAVIKLLVIFVVIVVAFAAVAFCVRILISMLGFSFHWLWF